MITKLDRQRTENRQLAVRLSRGPYVCPVDHQQYTWLSRALAAAIKEGGGARREGGGNSPPGKCKVKARFASITYNILVGTKRTKMFAI